MLSQKAGINEINSDYRFQKLQIANFKDYMDILLCWIESKDIEEIRKVWFENHKDIDFEAFYTLLASGFTYLLPWIYSSFVLLCSFLLNLKETDIPDKIKSTSSFIKYGLNTKLSCLAKVIGIKTRSTALYLEKESRTIKEKDFLSWMANLSLNEINAFKLNQIEKENIKDVVLRMNLKSNKMQPTHFAFKVKGTFYNTDFKENSKKVFEGSALNLLRDSKNKFDPFAILIRVGEAAIGYVTSEYTKFIATEMDLNDTHYLVKATSVKENVQKDYNEIHVENR